ncbi:DUF1501 domain-containing protein [Zavarzinella formosa]|uniref:DUF1501 domain-containing protein n=1 Tax=Zavarzinella formosa TaxID=360055 RepID=UPI000319914D|nr:DUF1501 domain-containing protein [Zavarzinella formosa]
MNQPANIARRYFLQECGIGLGKMAGAALLANGLAKAAEPSQFAPKKPHYAGKAKAVIHLFMAGAPSHLDLFDYKPELAKWEGKSLPEAVTSKQRFAFIRADAAVMGPRFKFKKFGKAGTEIADILPHLGGVIDDVCLIRSVQTDQFNHAPAQIFLNTGFSQPGRPSLGSWVLYGIGSEAKDLPAFVVMSTGSGISGGAANWSSGFLPSTYTGVRFRNQGDPILNVQRPPGIDEQLQRDSLDAIGQLNRKRLETIRDPEIETRIANYEMAFRLQSSAPELMDLSKETKQTLEMYGADPAKPSFARACLLARRMVERGVRFINIYHEGWDAHSDLTGNHTGNCKTTDQPSAALVRDLKQRGLLDSTLVIWGGEFGRTPMVESNPVLGRSNGRDHLPTAFSMWMAGGGIKPGIVHGGTDELGYQAVEKPVHVHDLQATILHTLGLDHERLTFKYAGRDFRLTDVHGHVVKDILS